MSLSTAGSPRPSRRRTRPRGCPSTPACPRTRSLRASQQARRCPCPLPFFLPASGAAPSHMATPHWTDPGEVSPGQGSRLCSGKAGEGSRQRLQLVPDPEGAADARRGQVQIGRLCCQVTPRINGISAGLRLNSCPSMLPCAPLRLAQEAPVYMGGRDRQGVVRPLGQGSWVNLVMPERAGVMGLG